MTTENLPNLIINKLSQKQFDREKANGTLQDTELYLTPDTDMSSINPTGTGSFSLNRKEDSPIGRNSFAEGTDTVAGGKCFIITAGNEANKTFTLDSIAGLSRGDVISCRVDYNFDKFATIEKIEDNVITISKALASSYYDKIGTDSAVPAFMWVPGKPELGTTDMDMALEDDYLLSAHAEGLNTIAQNIGAHAEGSGTIASGRYSHTEGVTTFAAYASHAEGKLSEALGDQSHAEGYGALAKGTTSHAEGARSEANGETSHAEGTRTKANSHSSHSEGYETEVAANANYGHAEGLSTKVLDKAGHAEGELTEAKWEAHAEGYATKAYGNYAHSEGYKTEASGNGSHAEGANSKATAVQSHAEGNNTLASGDNAHAEGLETQSTGNASHAEGRNTKAIGWRSHTEGDATEATAGNAHAEGSGTKATGDNSHAEGLTTVASGNAAHAEGKETQAIGWRAHAEGEKTTANGANSHTEGDNTSTGSNAKSAHAEGSYTIVEAEYGHAEGVKTTVSGARSHAEGNLTVAAGEVSHTEGGLTVTGVCNTDSNGNFTTDENGRYVPNGKGGKFAHAEGYRTIASGEASHAENNYSKALGNYSHAGGAGGRANNEGSFAHGKNITADANNQAVFGTFNEVNTDAAFIIGNGVDQWSKANAFEVNRDGNTFVEKDLYVGGTGSNKSNAVKVATMNDIDPTIPKRVTNIERVISTSIVDFIEDNDVAYIKEVPENVAPYAALNKVGGISYASQNQWVNPKVTDIDIIGTNLIDYGEPGEINSGNYTTDWLLEADVLSTGNLFIKTFWTQNSSKYLTSEGQFADSEIIPFNSPIVLPAGTYSGCKQIDSTGGVWTLIFKAYTPDGLTFIKDIEGENVAIDESFIVKGAFVRVYFIGIEEWHSEFSGIVGGENIQLPIMLARGSISKEAVPCNYSNIELPTKVTSLEGYGQGVKGTSKWYSNYIDFENKTFVKQCKKIIMDSRSIDIEPFNNGSSPFMTTLQDTITCSHNLKIYASNSLNFRITIELSSPDMTNAEVDTYIAQQKAAGTPVTLLYGTPEPEVIDISDVLNVDNYIPAEPNGLIIFNNEDKLPVASSIEYQNLSR